MRPAAPLKITHVVYSFDYGGLERRILRLVSGLSPYGVKFRVVSLRPSKGAFLDQVTDVEHIVLNARPGIDPAAIARLARILADTHVVHSHNWVSMMEGIVAGRLAGVPAIVHGEHGASRFEPQALRWQRTIVQALLARSADALVSVNDSIRTRMAAVWKIPETRCTIIRNGVDTDKYHPSPREHETPVVIGSISRLEPIKNFPCLIRAVHRLNTAAGNHRFRLVLVGEGADRARLQAEIKALNAGAYVELPGASDAPETCYPRFDLYVNSSFSEGMSNTVLEAMSCGLPVVATDVAGHRDWLTPETNALFFASNDHVDLARQLSVLADSPTLRAAMGARNRARVLEHFSQTNFIRSYEQLYRRLLAREGYSDPFPR